LQSDWHSYWGRVNKVAILHSRVNSANKSMRFAGDQRTYICNLDGIIPVDL